MSATQPYASTAAGACQCFVGVAVGLLRFVFCHGNAGTRDQRRGLIPPCRCRDGIVRPASCGFEIAVGERHVRDVCAVDGRRPIQVAQTGPAGVRRLHRLCTVACRQMRDHQADVARAQVHVAEVFGRRDARLGDRPRLSDVALVRECPWKHQQRVRSQQQVVIGLGFGHQLAQLGGPCGEVALHHLRASQPPPALPRTEAVPDGVGNVAAFLPGLSNRNGIPGHEGRMCLLTEDVVQPPLVSDCTGQTDRLGEISLSHFGVVHRGSRRTHEVL